MKEERKIAAHVKSNLGKGRRTSSSKHPIQLMGKLESPRKKAHQLKPRQKESKVNKEPLHGLYLILFAKDLAASD